MPSYPALLHKDTSSWNQVGQATRMAVNVWPWSWKRQLGSDNLESFEFIGKMKDYWKRDADATVIQQHFLDFWASRWGGVEKMKKIAFSLGRCRRMHFWRSHAAWGSQKKRSPCSMGRPTLRIATPLERERLCLQIIRFCCCGFWSMLGRQTGILAGSLKENLKMMKTIRLFENYENQNCC